jgi:PEP-CTERM motif-containing protein
MRLRRFPTIALVTLVLSGLGVEIAAADPVRITSGGLKIEEGDPPSFRFVGEMVDTGFTLFTSPFIGPGALGVGPFETCRICAQGAAIDLGTHASGLVGHVLSDVVPPVVGGETFSPVFYFGDLSFDAPMVTTPAIAGPGSIMLLNAPFVFTGQLSAFGSADRTGPELFSLNLRGEGNAEVLISALNGPTGLLWGVEDANYRFTSAAASPTPEPATLLLFAAGAVGVLRRRR